MTKEDIKFQIDQLRKDKIVYAVESVACTLAALLFWVFMNMTFPRANFRQYYIFGFAVALVSWFITIVGNTRRLMEIHKLEKDLWKKKKK